MESGRLSSLEAENLKDDVIIVGAGLSGLSAAHHLLKKDASLKVRLLEAKDRIGGRTVGEKLQASRGAEFWDLGGQWIGTCQPHVMELINEFSLEVYTQYTDGRKILQLGDNRVCTYKSDIPNLQWYALLEVHLFMRKIEQMRKQVPIEDPGRCPHAQEWDSITLEQAVNKMIWSKAARETVSVVSRVMFGAEGSQLSFLYYLTYSASAGGIEPLIGTGKGCGQEFKIKGGAFQLCDRLAEKVGHNKIHYDEPVIDISQDVDGVKVKTLPGKVYSCQRVILAIPPSQARSIIFDPMLPLEKRHVFNRMPVGNLTKIIITYRTAFWREKGFSGEIITTGGPSCVEGCDKGPISMGFDASSASGSPALVVFIGAEQQLQYSKLSAGERQHAVLHSLSEYFGTEALEFIEFAEKVWNDEPYNGGCPVDMGTPGMMTRFAPALRNPFDKVHFAGTESATVWCGFLNGAIQAGYRAASEVLYNLRPDSVLPAELDETCYSTKSSKKRTRRIPMKCKVLRYTIGLSIVCVLAVVAKKAYFRIAL